MIQLLHTTNEDGSWGKDLLLGDDIYYCVSDYADKDILKEAGFRWNPVKKKWWTDSKHKAAKLVDFSADPNSEWSKKLSQIKMREMLKQENPEPPITECPICGRDGEPVIDHKRMV